MDAFLQGWYGVPEIAQVPRRAVMAGHFQVLSPPYQLLVAATRQMVIYGISSSGPGRVSVLQGGGEVEAEKVEVVQSPESRVQTRPEKLRLFWMPPPVNGSKFTRFSLWSGTGPSGDGIAVPVKGLKESLRLTIRDVASRRLFRRPDAGTASKPIVLPRLRPRYAGWRLLALWFQNRRPVSWSHRLCASPPFQRLLAERGSQRKQEKSLSNMSIAFLSRP